MLGVLRHLSGWGRIMRHHPARRADVGALACDTHEQAGTFMDGEEAEGGTIRITAPAEPHPLCRRSRATDEADHG